MAGRGVQASFLAPLAFVGLGVLVVVIMALSLASFMLQASLALVAFSFVMWVTMPWAYADAIDKAKTRAKSLRPELLADTDVSRKKSLDAPLDWLEQSTTLFLSAGIFFMVEALFELGTNAFPPSNPTAVPYLLGGVFLSGVAILTLAILRSHQVISFVLRPERLKVVSGWGLEALVMTRSISFLIISFFWFLDAVSVGLFWYAGIFFQPMANPLTFVQGVLFAVGAGGGVPVVWSFRREKVDWKDLTGPMMIAVPYIFLGIGILTKNL